MASSNTVASIHGRSPDERGGIGRPQAVHRRVHLRLPPLPRAGIEGSPEPRADNPERDRTGPGKAQGMQESEEIAGVAEAVYEEFNGLGYALNRAVVHLADDQSGYTRAYGFGDALDKSIEGLMVGRLHATEPGAARRRREARKHGEWYAIRELASAELRRTRRTNGKRAGLEREELAVFVNRSRSQKSDTTSCTRTDRSTSFVKRG